MTTTTNMTVAQGKALMRSSKMERHWNTARGVYESWSGWCAAFCYWFSGAAHSYDTAYDAYLSAGTMVSKNAAKAPAGAFHYFRSVDGPRPGHVAPSLGLGIAAMATSRGTIDAWGDHSGTVKILDYIEEVKGSFTYLGWSYSFGTFRMRGVQNLAAVKAAAATVPATIKVKSGESLAIYRKRYGVSIAKIVALNKAKHPSLVHDPDTIQPGWTLRLK